MTADALHWISITGIDWHSNNFKLHSFKTICMCSILLSTYSKLVFVMSTEGQHRRGNELVGWFL